MRHTKRSLLGVLGAAATGLLLVSGSPPAQAASVSMQAAGVNRAAAPQPAPSAKPTRKTLLVTFYGFPDNSPPGTDIAFPQIHSGAGGTGTFKDPVTFATAPKEFKPGTRVYVPFLKKYFLMEDECVACDQDFANGKQHIDLWTGGTASSDSDAQIQCEDSLTRDRAQIIVNPASNQPVDTTPLFDDRSGACFQP